MKTWLLSELFYPVETSTGYFMTKIAERLGEEDPNGIHVICGPDKYDSDKLLASHNLNKNVIIHRVNVNEFNKNSLVDRSKRMVLLACKMGFKLFKNVKKNDRVFIVTNPAPLLLLIALIKRIKGFKFIIIVHDVFPENLLPGGILKRKSLSYKVLRRIFNIAYRQADQIISVGEDMNELMVKKTNFELNQMVVIRNWADCDQIFPLELNQERIVDYYNVPDLKEKIVIQFAGNLGRVQGLTDFIRIYGRVGNPDLAMVFIGDGAIKDALISVIQKENIKNVYFISPKSREEQNVFLNACHIGLVSLNPGMFGLGVPSKTYNIWAAGKPVLFIGDQNSEIDRNIKKFDIGWSFNWNEERELSTFLRKLSVKSLAEIRSKGLKSREVVLQNFDREIIMHQFEKI